MITKIEREDLVEFRFLQIIICTILSLFLFFKLGFTLSFLSFCIFSYLLVFLSFIDLKYKAVPDYLLLAVLVLSFFITNFSLKDSFLNAFIASGAIFLLNFIVTFYIQNIKSKILKDETLKNQMALGEGDIPIIASMAVVLGLNSLVYAILLSAIIAILHTISINIVKKDIQIPFIPSLVLGFFIEYFFGLEHYIKAFY
jgi:leader peptidase (prepilin peptidase)/N-methyltransferase